METPQEVVLGICGTCYKMYNIKGQSQTIELLPCGHKIRHFVLSGRFLSNCIQLHDKVHDADLCEECAAQVLEEE